MLLLVRLTTTFMGLICSAGAGLFSYKSQITAYLSGFLVVSKSLVVILILVTVGPLRLTPKPYCFILIRQPNKPQT